MNTAATDESRHVACAENISLLHLLHKVPEPPSVSEPPCSIDSSEHRALELARELSLTSSLAFLSSITDNPNHVAAVCIQEQQGGAGLDVFLAINKENHKDCVQVLDKICNGFTMIFERLSAPGDASCENDIYKHIVSMCKSRILCRLGQRPGHRKTKAPVETVLEQARQSLLQLRGSLAVAKMKRYKREAASLSAQVLMFLEKSAGALRLIRKWLQHQTDDQLCAMMDGLRDLFATQDFIKVVDLIPDQLMAPSSRSSLVNMLGKVSRYREAARILYRTAKKVPAARRMRAVAVQMPQSAFQRVSPDQDFASLQQACSRVLVNQSQNPNTLNRICQKLQTTIPAASSAFAAQTKRTLREGKFHAEVQLLYHILKNPTATSPPPPPRVICASKDACFLCNLLIQAHAKVHTPRCHGKLYPGWRLPRVPELAALQISLNGALEGRIRDSVDTMFDSWGRRTVYPEPCESSYSAAALSDTTVAREESGVEEMETLASTTLDARVADTDPALKETTAQSNSDTSVADTRPTLKETVAQSTSDSSVANSSPIINEGPSTSTPSQPSSSHSTNMQPSEEYSTKEVLLDPSTLHPAWSVPQSYALAQGEVVASQLPRNRTSQLYTWEPLQVQLEYTTAQSDNQPSSREEEPKLHYRIQQLSLREAQALRESSYIPVIDVASLGKAEERSFKLHESASLYLGAGDCIFRLTLEPWKSSQDHPSIQK